MSETNTGIWEEIKAQSILFGKDVKSSAINL
jgi:hypothetical protein